ncbi:MAG: hypothetical protein H6710_03940 [Myxococcales bacterium]|nr:hypothetical protein [Myxococcales bacterium]MCB9705781.1 hypothetical protein [Myxococcales bacterium]
MSYISGIAGGYAIARAHLPANNVLALAAEAAILPPIMRTSTNDQLRRGLGLRAAIAVRSRFL